MSLDTMGRSRSVNGRSVASPSLVVCGYAERLAHPAGIVAVRSSRPDVVLVALALYRQPVLRAQFMQRWFVNVALAVTRSGSS